MGIPHQAPFFLPGSMTCPPPPATRGYLHSRNWHRKFTQEAWWAQEACQDLSCYRFPCSRAEATRPSFSGIFQYLLPGSLLHVTPPTSMEAAWPSLTGWFHNSILTLAPPFIQDAHSWDSNVRRPSCTLDVDCHLERTSIHSCRQMCLLIPAQRGNGRPDPLQSVLVDSILRLYI